MSSCRGLGNAKRRSVRSLRSLLQSPIVPGPSKEGSWSKHTFPLVGFVDSAALISREVALQGERTSPTHPKGGPCLLDDDHVIQAAAAVPLQSRAFPNQG